MATKFDEINDQEKKFLQLACSEMTYHQIADKMFLSPKTIDGYRSSLFEKLKVKSRVGLALFAIKQGWVQRIGIAIEGPVRLQVEQVK